MHSKESAYDHLRYAAVRIALGVAICTLICIIGRAAFIQAYARDAFAAASGREWKDFINITLRFDIKAASYVYVPAAILALLCLVPKLASLYKKVFPVLNVIAFLFVTVLTVVEFYYFKTYDRIIDIFIFAAFREDAVAVFKTVIDDYPVIWGLVGLVIGTFLYLKLFNFLALKLERLFTRLVPQSFLLMPFLAAVILIVYGVCLRGSLGTFPLRQMNADVSHNRMINASVPNGTMALYWAWNWNKKTEKMPDVSKEDLQRSFAAFGLESPDDDLFKSLEVKLPENAYLKEHQPDVVFCIMESMSTHMLNYDDKDSRDLLGALRRHLDGDNYVFMNFLSEGNGTSDSMTRMFTGVPDLNLSSSVYAAKPYILNAFRPFKDAGYKVVFITGGQGSWRSLDVFLRQQGVDDVLEMSSVRRYFPDATQGTWGIDDEFVFGTALKLLKEPHDQPLLVITLSITNHPPYRVPAAWEPKAVPLTDEEKARFPYENVENIFATYRYANDQLGRFIDSVEGDEKLNDNTIVAFTGDHNLRGIGYTAYPEEDVLGHAVPFFLRLPEGVAENTEVNYDQNRFGSHKDIFRTIAAHALSGVTLHSLGCDLLSASDCAFMPYNSDIAVVENGTHACPLSDEEAEKKPEEEQNSGEGEEALVPKDWSEPLLPGLLVGPQDGVADCSRAKALKELQKKLYYYQAKLETDEENQDGAER